MLGYPDEDGGLPLRPAPPFDRNSTYVVYRKMQMHPERMRSYLRAAPGRPRTSLAAKLVGRRQDGTPLISSPSGPIRRSPTIRRASTTSATHEDPAGPACPVGAHIRRANPRDADGFFDGKLSIATASSGAARAYGPALPDGALEDDGVERGWRSSAIRRISSGSSR